MRAAEVERWQERVQGLVLPAPVAGHPGLELANTWAHWSAHGTEVPPQEPHEYLTTWRHLAVLVADRAVVDPSWGARWPEVEQASSSADLDQALAEARLLRPATYRALMGQAEAQDLRLLGDLATQARRRQRLRPATRDGGRAEWEWAADPDARTPVLAAAAAATDLLVSPDAAGVGRCGGRGCGWLFLDPTRRRRWCLMAVCGNRAKARAHAARRRQEAI